MSGAVASDARSGSVQLCGRMHVGRGGSRFAHSTAARVGSDGATGALWGRRVPGVEEEAVELAGAVREVG